MQWLANRLHLPFNVTHKRDRVALYAALSTPFSLIMACIKLVLGLLYLSGWLLIFGVYYLVLVGAKVVLLWRYHHIRVSDAITPVKIIEEQGFLRHGGLILSLIGVIFGVFCAVMYLHGYQHHFGRDAALLVATMGFIKIISAIVGLVRARRLFSPLISLLKAYSLADGMTAIVLTQYALLTYTHSAQASNSTGLFGMAVSAVIVVAGLWIAFFVSKRRRTTVE